MLILVLSGIAVLISLAVHYNWRNRKLNELCKQLPGPRGFPMIGNGLLFFGSSTEFITKIKLLIAKYGTPFHLKLAHKLYIFIDNPDDIQIVMNSPNANDKDEVYRFMRVPGTTGTCLVISNGEQWKNHRKLLNPAFNASILQSYIPIFNRCGRIVAESVNKFVDEGEVFDIEESIHTCSLNMIVETSLGTQMNFKRDSKVLVAIERFMKIVGTRMFKFWLHPNVFFRLSTYYSAFKSDCNVFMTFAQDILRKIKTKTEINEHNTSKSFINQLLKISNTEDAFSDDDVIGETVLAIIAGNETSATVMSNTILLLAMHPEVQKKVYAELREVFKNQNVDIDAEEIQQLVYLDMVIKETQRVFAVIPLITRFTTGDVTLSNGVTVSKGCNIAMALFSLHQRHDIWGEDADVFRPERFAAEEHRHPYSFLPYSGGPRICIGYKYAPTSMKIALTYLLRRYEFATKLKIDELKWCFGITQRLENKHLITATRRNWT